MIACSCEFTTSLLGVAFRPAPCVIWLQRARSLHSSLDQRSGCFKLQRSSSGGRKAEHMATDKPPRQWKSMGVEVQVSWFANGQRKLLPIRLGNLLFLMLFLAIVVIRPMSRDE